MNMKFKVFVDCITYNHSSYIEETLKGFVMQITNFPYICCIIDDASTDGEQEVINQYVEENFDFSDKTLSYKIKKEYGTVIFAPHKTNNNCFFAVIYLNENHYSKNKSKRPYFKEWFEKSEYYAWCEGDDYWIDPMNLQKKVEILDNNPQVGMVYSNVKGYIQKDKTFFDMEIPPLSGDQYENMMMSKMKIATATKIARSFYLNHLPELPASDYFSGDRLVDLYISSQSELYYIPDITTVYRVLENSACHIPDKMKALLFAYRCQNDHLFFMKNVRTVSKPTEIEILRFTGNNLSNYALCYNRPDILKSIHYPIQCCKSFYDTLVFLKIHLAKCKIFFPFIADYIKRGYSK